jgi:type I restriction enzyme S subunit
MSWEKVKIKEVLKQYRVQHIVQDTIEYRQVSILNDGSVVLRGTKIGKEIGRKRQFKVDLHQYPDTLIFTRQLLLQGSVGIASEDVNDCIVTENMPMFSIQTSLIDKEFLILFLKSEVFKSRIRQIELSGSAQKSIHEKTFLDLEFLLPNINLQKVIVVELLKLKKNGDGISSELTHQLDLVKQLRQSFLREAMQGKLLAKDENANITIPPAKAGGYLLDNNTTFSDNEINRNGFQPILNDSNPIGFSQTGQQLLEKIKAEKAQLIAEKKIKKEKPLPLISEEEIPFEIPEHWTWCRLGDTGNLKRGKSKHRPRNDEELFIGGTIPFIQTGDVSKAKHNKDLITTINGYYNDFGLKQSELQIKGTLCITIAANIAECGFLDFDACLPDSIVCFLSIDKIIEKYVYYYLIVAKDELERFAPATAQKNINLGILNDLKIPLPPLHEQEQIVTKLEELMGFCDALEQSIKESQGYNEMLLQQVLREALQGEEV